MAATRVSSHDDIMRDFREKVQSSEITGICGRPFIRIDKLKTWLSDNVVRLLEAAYRSQDQPALPIHPDNVRRKDSLLIFSILLQLDHGNLIDRFHRLGLGEYLPIDLSTLKARLGSRLGDFGISAADANALAERFDKQQWHYCPAKFRLNARRDYLPSHIIPISKKEPINEKGGTATVWQIEVLEEFVEEPLRKVVPTSKFGEPGDSLGPRYSFALKSFEDGHKAEYDNEIIAFQALEGHEGIIRYLGDYGHRDYKSGKNTFNILLEYGELDLDEYFFDPGRLPPVLLREIHGFWTDLYEVATALKDIHTFERKRGDVRQEYYGWHADIKPDNILRVKGRFKLADPGFAKFKKSEAIEKLMDQTKRLRDQTTMIHGGTRTYGAPECHPGPRKQIHVPRSIDIWSLGCVFSVAASWVVLGTQGIKQFTHVRQRAISMAHNSNSGTKPGEPKGDHFHDGTEVLQDVIYWHNHLRKTCRGTDTITSQMLDLVDGKMLRGNAKERIEASKLCEEMGQILSKCDEATQDSLPETLKEALIQMNEEALSQSSQSKAHPAPASDLLGLKAVQDRKTRKSKLLDVPVMATSHRSEALKPESAPVAQSARYPVMSPTTLNEKIPVATGLLTPPTSGYSGGGKVDQSSRHHDQQLSHRRDQDSMDEKVALQKIGTSLSSARPSAKRTAASQYGTQNVWQAHRDMERRKRNSLFKRTGKDKLLTQHFGDRDIQFLVDNAETMTEWWDEATFLLETLVRKAHDQDDNGMDLAFFAGPVKLKGSNTPAHFTAKMEDEEARPTAGNRAHTDIRKPLGDIFHRYIESVKESQRNPKKHKLRKLTVIILTDGKWEGMSNKNSVEDQIVQFVKDLKAVQGQSLMERQVSFEFIQFGFDPDATYRLQRLDDELPYRDVPDIIDTEQARGDIIKMLLGSFVEEYDDKKSDSFMIPASPTTTRSSDYFGSISSARDTTILPDRNQTTSPPQMTPITPSMSQGLLQTSAAESQQVRPPNGALPHPRTPSITLTPNRDGSDGSGGHPRLSR